MTASVRSYDLHEALAPWVPTFRRFVAGDLDAGDFIQFYNRAYLDDATPFAGYVFDALDQMFAEADFYVADPALRTEPHDLGPDELRDCARDLLRKAGYAERPPPLPKSRAAEHPA